MKPFDPDTYSPKPGITLIEASAGTGKTYNISGIVTHLIRSEGAKIQEIVVLTFTNEATKELRSRIRKQLKEALNESPSEIDQIEEALEDIDLAPIQTIHSFCQRTLSEYYREARIPMDFKISEQDPSSLERETTSVLRILSSLTERNPLWSTIQRASGISQEFIVSMIRSINLWQSDAESAVTEDSESLTQDFSSWAESFKTLWELEGHKLKSIFTTKDTPLKSGKGYRQDELRSVFAKWDYWIKNDHPPISLFETVLRFQKPKLENVLKKDSELPNSRIYLLANDLQKLILEANSFLTALVQKTLISSRKRRIHEAGAVTYDDLISALNECLKMNPSVIRALRERYRYVLVDEFQDTDPIQFDILSKSFISPPDSNSEFDLPIRPLVLIGDPKQAIYGFRGGDIFTYGRAKDSASERCFLTTNWRSSTKLNQSVNALLTGSNPFHFPWIGYENVKTTKKNASVRLLLKTDGQTEPFDTSGTKIHLLTKADYRDQNAVLDRLLFDIRSLLGSSTIVGCENRQDSAVKLSDIAILVSTNDHASKVRNALEEGGLPSVNQGGASVYDSVEASDWLQIIQALEHPEDVRLFRGALLTQPFGISPQQLANQEEDAVSNEWALSFRRASEAANTGHWASAFNQLDHDFEWVENLARSLGGERSLANHQQIEQNLLEAASDLISQKESLSAWIHKKIEDPNPNNTDEIPWLSKETDAIRILTFHRSKGLQFPFVFIPLGISYRTFKELAPPFSYFDESGTRNWIYHSESISDAVKERKLTESESERLRSLYVAITRAEIQCNLYLRENDATTKIFSHWAPSINSAFQDPSEIEGEYPMIMWVAESHFDQFNLEESKLEFDQSVLIQPKDNSIRIPNLLNHWSFTRMVHSQSSQETDSIDDYISLANSASRPPDDSPPTLHNFPKGTQAGLFFHYLMENLDFRDSSDWDSTIRSALNSFQYPEHRWAPLLKPWFQNLVETLFVDLNQDAFSLAELETSNVQFETEFNIPFSFDSSLYSTLRQKNEDWFSRLPGLDTHEPKVSGFLKGIIDCWLLHQGKYYIVDWKSNWLGGAQDYNRESMTRTMDENHYHLQYLLYAIALRKYFRLANPEFDYSSEFGGVFYVFLRGVDHGLEPDKFLFRALPLEEELNELENCLTQ